MNTDSPLVSAVVPTHDRPDRLTEAVESVAAQTYDRIELVVVDDGSTADVRGVVDDRSLGTLERVRVLEHEVNQGANAARNSGVRAADGEYVAFLDDDDRWRPAKVERQVETLRAAADEVAVAFTGQQCVNGSGTTTNVVTPTTDGQFLDALVHGASFGPFSTVLVDADAFDRTGYLDESLPCWQDREWYLRLAAEFEYVAIREPLTIRTCSSDGVSSNYESRRDVAHPRIVEKHRTRIAAEDPALEQAFLATMTRAMGGAAVRAGQYREAVRFLLQSLRRNPTSRWTYGYLAAALGGPATHLAARTGKRWVNRLRDRPGPRSDASSQPAESATAPPTDGD